MVEPGQLFEFFSNDLLCLSCKRQPIISFMEQRLDGEEFRDIQEVVTQEILLQLDDNLFTFRMNPIIEIEMRDVGTDEDQVTLFIKGDMVAYMPGAAGSFYIYDLVFRMKMPEESVVQSGCQ